MTRTTWLEHRLEVVERLVRYRLASEEYIGSPGELLDPEADFATAATYFVLGLDGDGGVEWFIVHTLPRLLQQLSRSTERREIEYRGQVRGRVLWPATYKARYTGDFDPTRYVCRETRNRYDMPENQLLKYLMEQIVQCLKAVPEIIRQGTCYLPYTERRFAPSTATRLERMETMMYTLWRNVHLREISTPSRITEQHLLRAETARMEEYSRVAHIYMRYHDLVLAPTWESLVKAGRWALPLPARTGASAERWIKLGATIMSWP